MFSRLILAAKVAMTFGIVAVCATAAETKTSASELRVVSLSPALTELVYQLGRGSVLVGRSDVCDFPVEVRKLPVVGKFASPSVEKLLTLRPTLVLTDDLVNPGQADFLRKFGIQVELLPIPNLAGYRAAVLRVGELLAASSAAAAEVKRIDGFLASLPDSLGIRVLWVVWDAPLMVAGKGSLPDEVLRLAGAENVAGRVTSPYFKCSFEWLLSHPADIVVWSGSTEGWKRHRVWAKLEAVRRGRILADLDSSLVQRPGPRLPAGVLELHRRLAEAMR